MSRTRMGFLIVPLLLFGCGAPAPPGAEVTAPDQLEKLAAFPPPPAPPLTADPDGDEAEIQFRAALAFYTKAKYQYAITAFAEALELADREQRDRDDIRYYLAVSLLLGGRPEEALSYLDRLDDREDALWFTAKAQLARRDKAAARAALEELIARAGKRQHDAQSLLDALP